MVSAISPLCIQNPHSITTGRELQRLRHQVIGMNTYHPSTPTIHKYRLIQHAPPLVGSNRRSTLQSVSKFVVVNLLSVSKSPWLQSTTLNPLQVMIHGWEKAHCQIGYVMRFPSLALVCIALFSTTDSASGQDVDVTLDQAVNNEKSAWNPSLPGEIHGIYNPSSNEQLSPHGRLLREMKAANHDNEQPGIASEGTVVRPRLVAATATRSTEAHARLVVKIGARTPTTRSSHMQSAWGVHTNGRDLYNLAKGRKLIAANRDDERHGEVALVPPTQLRHHRKKSRGARKARRQNWVTNAYNKVKPY
ncbi:hypothetical protein AC1031_021624 [Aphanomyces cochlioides]|nr:hypothetical protein AC1031_021624 [Aphanomyces cochlioides]